MKRATTALTATIIAAGLALAGCASTPADSSATAPEKSSADTAPLVAETPTASPSADEEAFIADVRDKLQPSLTLIPNATDEQLLAAGWEACERRDAGETVGEDISLIEGEERNEGGYYLDSIAIVSAAWTSLCPAG